MPCSDHALLLKATAQTAVLCRGLEKNGMVRAWYGHGMASVNKTRPHCVYQRGKTYSKTLAARHDRGTAFYVWIGLKGKVKCTLVQATRICTGCTAHRGNRGIVLPFHDQGTRRVWGVGVTPRPLFTPGKDPVPIVQGAWWAPGPVWTGAEILAYIGFRSSDRPARSQSLYRLNYPAHQRYSESI